MQGSLAKGGTNDRHFTGSPGSRNIKSGEEGELIRKKRLL